MIHSFSLLEKPEYKRRWAQEPWEKRQERALRDWLLDRLEDRRFWFDAQGRPLPRSVAQLADEVARDADMVSVLALWEGRPDVPVTQSLVRLLADEAVPYPGGLPVQGFGAAEAGGVGGDLAAAAAGGCRGEGRDDPGAAEVHLG